jgi:hypothetical protein
MWGMLQLSRRPFLATLLVALALHLPMVPSWLSDWIRLLFVSHQVEPPPEGPQQEMEIPLELDMGLGGPGDNGAPAPTAPPEAQSDDDDDLEAFDDDDDDDPDAGAQPQDALDAGLDDASDHDAGIDDAPDAGAPEPASELPDAGAPELDGGLTADAGPPLADGLRDPNQHAGGAASVGPEHANVRIFIAADVLRKHARLAESFGDMLNAIPQWSQLLGGTDLNPIRDFDHLYIAGPQMRDPRWIWIALDYNIANDKMQRSIGEVVKKSAPGGKWLRPVEGMRVAAVGNKAERRVVMMPDKRMLAILPADAEDQIPRLKSPKFKMPPSTGAGIALFVITPGRAFARSGFDMPASVKWLKLAFTPTEGGDFEVVVEGEDASEKDAEKTLDIVRKQIDGRPDIVLALGKPSWERDGATIRGRVSISSFRLRLIMGYASSFIKETAERAAKGGKAPKPAPKPKSPTAPKPAATPKGPAAAPSSNP